MRTRYRIITLHPESERSQALLAALKSQGLDGDFFQAVDGRNAMPALENDESLARVQTRIRHRCDLTPPEVGCYLSHLRLIKQAWRDGVESLCILEDDVHLEPDFGRIMSDIESLPADVEMVRLMGLKIRKRKQIQSLGGGTHHLVRPERGWLGTQAYYLNRAGMEKVIRHARVIREPIDKMYDHFWEANLRLFGVEPHLVFEENAASSIVKSNVAVATVPAWYHWLNPLAKGLFSLRRHWHLLMHRREFYPAKAPTERMGRSRRIRR